MERMGATDRGFHDLTAARLGVAWIEGAILQQVLGSGGTSVVYLSTLADGRQVAVKVLHPEWVDDLEIRSSLELEAQLLARLNHPGLPASYGQGNLPSGEPFFVMERLHGATLSDVLAGSGGLLAPPDVFHILDRTLEVLAVLHDAGIAHRDIKPSNLFLTLDGRVKLLDLGAALLLNDTSRPPAQRLIGSPSYMAPEQATNATLGVDKRSDVFAVGATMYHLLSGRTVRTADTLDDLFKMASSVPVGSLSRVMRDAPVSLSRLVDRALSWVPADRFADSREMLAALRQVAEAENIPPSPLALAGGAALRKAIGLRSTADTPAIDPQLLQRMQGCLRELFRRLSRCILALRRHSVDSPEFRERISSTREALDAAFRESGGDIALNVLPYAIAYAGLPVWEPETGLEDVPYFLFQSGFRVIRLRPEVDTSELTRFVRVMSIDPLRDLDAADDLATVFQEAALVNIEAEILSGFDVDLLESYESFGEQVRVLNHELEAEAHRALQLDKGMAELAAALGRAGVAEADAVDLNYDADATPGGLELWEVQDLSFWPAMPERAADEAERWQQRTVRALVHAYHRALDDGDGTGMLDRVRDRLSRLAREGAAAEALVLVTTMSSMCEPAAAEQLLDHCIQEELAAQLLTVATEPRPEWPDQVWAHHPTFATFLDLLPARCTPAIFQTWIRLSDEALIPVYAGAIYARSIDNEAMLGAVLARAPEVQSLQILRWLDKPRQTVPLRYLAQGLENPSEAVQASAVSLLLLRGYKPVVPTLERLVNSKDARIRREVFRLVQTYRPEGMAPIFEAIARSARFNEFPLAERQAVMVVFSALAPGAARQLLEELIRPQRWTRDDQEATTRQLAAELLVALFPDAASLRLLEAELRRVFRMPTDVRQTFVRLAQELKISVVAGGDA
jgi:serine/threonine protein kinase